MTRKILRNNQVLPQLKSISPEPIMYDVCVECVNLVKVLVIYYQREENMNVLVILILLLIFVETVPMAPSSHPRFQSCIETSDLYRVLS